MMRVAVWICVAVGALLVAIFIALPQWWQQLQENRKDRQP